jgi:hypothetical protein
MRRGDADAALVQPRGAVTTRVLLCEQLGDEEMRGSMGGSRAACRGVREAAEECGESRGAGRGRLAVGRATACALGRHEKRAVTTIDLSQRFACRATDDPLDRA